MSKSNPLFVDSTLLRGDSIGTQIEISGVLLLDGEAIYLVLLNENDEEMCLPMSPSADFTYEAFARLVHQRPVRFYFGIAKDGELLYRTRDYERTAMYALLESWDPVPVYQPLRQNSVAESHSADAAEEAMAPASTVEVTAGAVREDLPEPQNSHPAGTLKEPMPPATLETAHARSAPVFMPDELGQISQLLTKWGFS